MCSFDSFSSKTSHSCLILNRDDLNRHGDGVNDIYNSIHGVYNALMVNDTYNRRYDVLYGYHITFSVFEYSMILLMSICVILGRGLTATIIL